MSIVVARRDVARPAQIMRQAGARTLQGFFAGLQPDWHSQWAWDHYEDVVLALARHFNLTQLCEIGGGRDPGFLPDDPKTRGLALTVNDIDQGELDLAPAGLAKARFDIAGDMSEPAARPCSFDLMFSRMVFEHVADVERAWGNIHRLLKPGGVALAFNPTLWAPVFALNHVIPESLSRRIVHALFPNRREGGGDPKFPAHYNWCRGSERLLRPMLARAGFADIHVQPFWGHGYFERMPGLRQADHAFNRLSARWDFRLMTTYAFVVVRKS